MSRGVIAATCAAAAVMLTAAGCRTILTVSDAVQVDGVPTLLTAYAETQILPGIWHPARGVKVQFRVDDSPVGNTVTDADGYAGLHVTVPRDAKQFCARGRVVARQCEDKAKVFHWPANRTIMIFDIDGTISQTDWLELYLKESSKNTVPIQCAAETLRELSRRYNIMYLSARPRVLLDTTEQWLARNHFPPGPLLTASNIDQGLEAERFKAKAIRHQKTYLWQILIGVGNLESDAEAYGAAGLLTLIRHKRDDRKFRAHAIVLPDYAAIRAFFAANAAILEDPARLRRALECRQMLLQQIFPYQPRR